jgi:hypothetical protein
MRHRFSAWMKKFRAILRPAAAAAF